MRILVVEDEPRLADTIRRGLGNEGFTVDVAHDGVEALLVDGDEAAGLAVARLLCEPALHRALAGHNRAVPSAFTWDETTRLTRLAYALATGETAPAGPAGAERSYR